MEAEGLLDRSDDFEIFPLHFCVESLLRETVNGFMEAWNSHPLRTEKNRSPLQLFYMVLQN